MGEKQASGREEQTINRSESGEASERAGERTADERGDSSEAGAAATALVANIWCHLHTFSSITTIISLASRSCFFYASLALDASVREHVRLRGAQQRLRLAAQTALQQALGHGAALERRLLAARLLHAPEPRVQR